MSASPAPLPDDVPALFSSAAGDAFGISKARLRGRDLGHPFVGVRARTPVETVQDRARAYACILAPGEFFSHVTAAVLHRMWLEPEHVLSTVVHVSVAKPRRAPRNAGVIGHHLVDRPGLIREVDGLPVSSPLETWCQLASVLTVGELVVAGDSLLAKGRPNTRVLLERMGSASHDSRRPWHKRMHRAAELIRCDSRSPGETKLRLLLAMAGLPEPRINAAIGDDAGRFVAESDLVYRREKVLLEYEGDGHRTDKRQFRKDLVRYERLQDLGWRVVRVTADDLVHRPQELVERIRRLLLERA